MYRTPIRTGQRASWDFFFCVKNAHNIFRDAALVRNLALFYIRIPRDPHLRGGPFRTPQPLRLAITWCEYIVGLPIVWERNSLHDPSGAPDGVSTRLGLAHAGGLQPERCHVQPIPI